MRALVLQHVPVEGPGTLAPYLETRGQLFIPALIIGARLSAVLMHMARSVLLLTLDAVMLWDYTMVQGAVMFFATVMVGINLYDYGKGVLSWLSRCLHISCA